MTWVQDLADLPAIGVAVTGGLLVILDNRRTALGVLAVQYALVSWLVGLAIPLPIAATKLVAGLMASGALAVTASSLGWASGASREGAIPAGRVFRWVAVLLVVTVAVGMSRTQWLGLPGIGQPVMLGATLLVMLGLLQIGLSEDPVRVGLGLLTLFSGFETVYNTLEPSLAVIALLAAVHLGVAVVVSYLLLVARPQADEEEAA